MPEGTRPDWNRWGLERGGSPLGKVPELDADEFAEMRAQNVMDHLLRLDVDPSIAAELSSIDPRRTYVVRVTVKGGSGREGKSERKGAADQNTVILVGSGQKLWGNFQHLADPDGGGSELLDIEILNPAVQGKGEQSFPLWGGESIALEGGGTVWGTGERARWEATRPVAKTKAARPKRLSKRAKKLKAGAERSRKYRARQSSARIEKLKKEGNVNAAAALTKRRTKQRNRKRKK